MLDDQAIATAAKTDEEDLFRVDVRGRVLVTDEEMVAALAEFGPEEITPENIPDAIGTALAMQGLSGLKRAAAKVAADEKAGQAGERLPRYRSLVREFTGQAPAAVAVAA